MSTDDSGNETTRDLGLLVARGTMLTSISPVDGSEEIPNPFAAPEDGEAPQLEGETGQNEGTVPQA